MPASSEWFECENCHQAFIKAWTDVECAAEAAARFPGLTAEEEAIVCDGCYREMMAWLAAQGLRPPFPPGVGI